MKLKNLKQKFLTCYLIDGAFLAALFWFVVFVRNKIQGYLDLINQYSPEIAQLGESLKESTASISQLDKTVNLVSGFTNQAEFFLFVALPLGLLLLWMVFQGSFWSAAKVKNFKFKDIKKIFNWRYYLNFILVTVIAFVFVIICVNILSYLFQFLILDIIWLFVSYIILIFAAVYFVFIIYSVMENKLFEGIKKGLSVGVKKFKILLPLIFVLVLVCSIILIALSYLFAGYVTGFMDNIVWVIIFIAVVLLIRVFLKILIVKYSEE